MAKSGNLAEKVILFAVFFVFAILVVAFAYGWDDITGESQNNDNVISFQYLTQSKSDSASSTSPDATGLININKASVSELDTLPGIGKARAEAIIEYREKNGGFKAKEDIMNVSGIGEGIYDKLKDLITVN